ncbi:MAG: type III polyketide synthase [Solirubrobacterales bacterium]|nr:type III polyketide synthase [Solirubrobacterales bacterium]
MTATLTASHSTFPQRRTQQELWDGYFDAHYDGSELARKVFAGTGIATRHGVTDPLVEDVSGWSTQQRMERFAADALPLGTEAVRGAITAAGLTPAEIDLLTVVSCTGYATPGLDILIARDLEMPVGVQRLHVGHMGCYAAIPGLATTADAVTARGRTAVMLCLELTSLHVQPPTDDAEQVVAHALFADAANAVVLRPGEEQRGLRVLDIAARTDSARSALMTWDVTDLGFRMGLSPRVPAILRKHVEATVEDLLAPHGLTAADVPGWAVHPGGPRIVEVVQKKLALSDEQVAESQGVLRDCGNCSSPTVMLVLERMVAGGRLERGDKVVAMAFGPGLTLYMALLEVT